MKKNFHNCEILLFQSLGNFFTLPFYLYIFFDSLRFVIKSIAMCHTNNWKSINSESLTKISKEKNMLNESIEIDESVTHTINECGSTKILFNVSVREATAKLLLSLKRKMKIFFSFLHSTLTASMYYSCWLLSLILYMWVRDTINSVCTARKLQWRWGFERILLEFFLHI